MDDLDAKESKSDVRESPSIHLVDKKYRLRDVSDNEHDFEVNFRHGGHKGHETGTPIDIGGSLGDEFFMI